MGLIPGAVKGARLQDEAFNSLFQRMPTPAMLVETGSGRVAALNRAFQDAFGWRVEAVIDNSELDFPFWMNGHHRKLLLDRLTSESESSIETTFKCRDGSPRRSRASVSVLELAGKHYRLYLFEEYQARPAEIARLPVRRAPGMAQPAMGTTLQQSRDSLSLALEAAQMGIWDWEISSRLINSSARAADLHGLPPELSMLGSGDP